MSNSEQARVVADRYLLLDRLGSGGMGTVWRARDQLLGRTVAVKEMRLQTRRDGLTKQVQRAHREARAIARISHPGVINVYDLVDQDDGLWLVMELVDGPSLAEHVAATGPMTPSAVASTGLQLLSALEAVHATGALHRDIKPGNVLLRPDGRVVLCDFGIAALVGTETLTTTGAVVGSLWYIAPERLDGQSMEPASDLFSLGATLCALLSGGRSPFARGEAVAVLNAVAHARPDIPDGAGPLRRPLEALLRKAPAERPSIAEAAEMLRPVAEGPVAEAAPPTRSTRQRRQSSDGGARGRHLPRRLVLSAVPLLAGGITAGFLVNRYLGDEEAGTEKTPPAGKPPATGGASAGSVLTHVDAVMPVPDDPDLEAPSGYWLFDGDHYLRVRASPNRLVAEHLAPVSPLGRWSNTLGKVPGFQDGIDAVLRLSSHQNEYWVFSGDQYIRIRVGDGEAYDDALVTGSQPISDWQDPSGEFPPNGIDAVMPVPDDSNQVWLFSGNQYVRMELNGEKPGGRVKLGPAGFDGWSATLGKISGFRKGIDAAMPVPGERNQYWVFSGTQYMKIGVTDKEYADTLIQPPKELHV